MNGRWIIDDTDIYQEMGALILKGNYLEIMSPPEPKKRLEYNYEDKSGISVDTTSPLTYREKRFKLSVAIIASSYSEFWNRYTAFIALIDKPGLFSFYILDLGITVNLLYESAKCISKSRSLKNGGSVVAVYEISVLEPDPTQREYD